MNRKKIIVGLASAFSIISGMMITVPSHAVSLVLDLSKLGQGVIDFNDIKPIHFSENNNDFGGLFYFLGGSNESNTGEGDGGEEPDPTEPGDEETENTYTITFSGGETTCMEQKRGLYYNAERGERLRPIDEKTNDAWFNGLDMEGGIFTRCPLNTAEYELQIKCCREYDTMGDDEKAGCDSEFIEERGTEACIRLVEEKYADSNSYYGIVTHNYSGQSFLLTVGVKYATGTPWVEIIPERGKTFQANPNMGGGGKKLPFGLIYDNNGGVGFVGCKVNQFEGIKELIEGGVNETGIINFFELTGSDSEDKPYLHYINDNDVNPDFNRFNCKDIGRDMTTALGILVEGLIGLGNKTEDYSIWDQNIAKSQYFASASVNNATLINHARQKAEMLCRGKRTSPSNPTKEGINCFIGDRRINPGDMGKTIIVKNGNVTITPFAEGDDGYYDIFIDSGNLIIDERENPNGIKGPYDTYDYLIANDGFVNSSNVIGTFETQVEGIIEQINDGNLDNSQDSFNTLTDVGVASILKGNFIVNGSITGPEGGHLKRKYFIYGKLTSLDNNEKLRDTFEWRCNSGIPTYGKYCYAPGGGVNVHSYQNVPLAIIDQNYDSPLLK